MSLPSQISIQQCVDYLRTKKVLSKWTDGEIALQIVKCINTNTLIFSIDAANQLTGICFARRISDKALHIIALAGDRGTLKSYMAHLKDNYPEVEYLTGERSGKLITYRIYGRRRSTSNK